MRNQTTRYGLLVLLIFSLCLALIPSAQAQEIQLLETFEDPALPDWEVADEINLESGILTLPEGSRIHHRWNWHVLEVAIRLRLFGTGEFSFTTRATEGGALSLLLSREYMAVVLNEEIILEAPIESIPEGEWITLVLFIDPDHFLAEINGQLIFEEDLGSQVEPQNFTLGYLGTGKAEVDSVEGGGITLPGEKPEDTKDASDKSETSEETAPGPPAYQAGAWIHLGGPIGGLGYDIRYKFDDHDTWYVTDAWAGIHRSQDDGLTWKPINQGITATKGVDGIPVFCVTVDPHDPQVIWLGTELTGQIYRSGNGGDSWVEMSNGISKKMRPLTFRGITVHPDDPNTLYAMAEISSAAWTPNGEPRAGIEMDLTQGIVYKTTDGAQNWEEIWRGDNLARYAWINPDDPEVVYISTGIFDRESANTDVEADVAGGVGILKTTDGGQTWDVIDQDNGLLDLYVGSLYMHPKDPQTLLAAAAQNNWSAMADEYTGGIFLTHDGGESWKRVIKGQEMYGSVEFCEKDPKIAYAASLEAVYRSEDGGETWQRFSREDNTWGPPGIIAGIPIDIQCDPDDTDRIFINNYGGGNFLSEDGGQTWVNASQGYSGAIMNQIVVVPKHPGWIYAGARSGLFRSTDGGQTWEGTAYPAEGMGAIAEIISLAIDPANPLQVVTSPDGGGGMIVSENGGNSWRWAEGDTFQAWTLAQSPSDPQVLYAGNTREDCALDTGAALIQEICSQAQTGFFRSKDGGISWQVVTQGPLPHKGFSALAVHPTNSEHLFAGTFQGGFATSTDGGKTWKLGGLGLPQKGIPALAIAVDPFYPESLLISLGEAGLYKSSDRGANWRMIAAGLDPEAPLLDILYDPSHSGVVYLADSFNGVHFSTDGGESWGDLNQGLTHRTARTLGISEDGSVLYVGIEGAGVYRLGTPPPVDSELIAFDSEPKEETEQAVSEPPQEEEDKHEPAAEETPQEEEENHEPEDSGDQSETICPTSYVPLLLAVGLIWNRRKKGGSA